MSYGKRKAVFGLSLEWMIIIIGLVLFAIIFIPIFVKILFNTDSAIGDWGSGIVETLTGLIG